MLQHGFPPACNSYRCASGGLSDIRIMALQNMQGALSSSSRGVVTIIHQGKTLEQQALQSPCRCICPMARRPSFVMRRQHFCTLVWVKCPWTCKCAGSELQPHPHSWCSDRRLFLGLCPCRRHLVQSTGVQLFTPCLCLCHHLFPTTAHIISI